MAWIYSPTGGSRYWVADGVATQRAMYREGYPGVRRPPQEDEAKPEELSAAVTINMNRHFVAPHDAENRALAAKYLPK